MHQRTDHHIFTVTGLTDEFVGSTLADHPSRSTRRPSAAAIGTWMRRRHDPNP